MYIKFLKSILFIVFITQSYFLSAQNADMQLRELMGKEDYFALNEQYPLLKTQTSEPYQLLTEAYLNTFFNNPLKANENIQKLFFKYSNWLPIENQLFLTQLMIVNEINMQNYNKVVSIYTQLIEQLTPHYDSLSLSFLINNHKLYTSLINVPHIEVHHAKKQTKIPLSKDSWGLLTLPIYAGKTFTDTLAFTLDFGATLSIIEEKYVDIVGIRVLDDSIFISDLYGASHYGKIGVADVLNLGEIQIKNVVFLISPHRILDAYPDNEMYAILGFPVLHALEKLQISRSALLISHTKKQNKSSSNMLTSNFSLFVQAKVPKASLCLHFDSGRNGSNLTRNYLSKCQENIADFATDTISIGLLSGIKKMEVFTKNNFVCRIGKRRLSFSSIYIDTADYLQGNIPCDGVLGLDILLQHKKIIIDFKNMYFEVK
jgi:hypothetical protein